MNAKEARERLNANLQSSWVYKDIMSDIEKAIENKENSIRYNIATLQEESGLYQFLVKDGYTIHAEEYSSYYTISW